MVIQGDVLDLSNTGSRDTDREEFLSLLQQE